MFVAALSGTPAGLRRALRAGEVFWRGRRNQQSSLLSTAGYRLAPLRGAHPAEDLWSAFARVSLSHRAVFTAPLVDVVASATRLSSSRCRVDGTFLLYFSVSGSEVMSPAIIRFTLRAPPL
jgi:hypothetical protein